MGKNGKVVQMFDSPEKAIKTRARNLPLGKCYVSPNWEMAREGTVMVSRQHVNGNLTIGIFLVDLFCEGVKDTFYRFNIPLSEFEELINDSQYEDALKEIGYELAHNIIFAGIDFADEFGINPHKNFEITRFILEEDNEKIPLLEIECGKDGMPVVMATKSDPKARIIAQLNKSAGPGNFKVFHEEDALNRFEDEDDFDDDDYDEDDESDGEDIYTWDEKDFEDYFEGKKEVSQEQEYEIINLLYYGRFPEEDFDLDATEEYKVFKELRIDMNKIMRIDSVNPEEKKAFEDCADVIRSDDKKKSLKTVEGYHKKFPRNPVFADLLFMIYMSNEKFKMAEEIVKENWNNYPKDVASFSNFVTAMIEKETSEIEKRLSGHFHINEIFPTDVDYTVEEIVDFYSAIAIYHAFKNNLKKADIYMALADEVLNWDEPYQQYAWIHAKKDISIKKLSILKDVDWKNAHE